MYLVVLSILTGLILGTGLGATGTANLWWSLVWGLIGALAVQFGLGWKLRQRVQQAMNDIQAILMDGQRKIQQKMSRWQVRPPGSIKQAQQEIERDQHRYIREALKATETLRRFYRWSPMLRRQVDTLQMQLNYQMQNYVEVDRLMPRCLMMDPVSMSMKLARMHSRKDSDAAIDAFYTKVSRRLRYGQGVVVHGLYAWILLKRKRVDDAHKALIAACGRADHDVLKRNRDHLANNRIRQFSNAGLGEEWYVLGLEQPKVQSRRQPMPGGRAFR